MADVFIAFGFFAVSVVLAASTCFVIRRIKLHVVRRLLFAFSIAIFCTPSFVSGHGFGLFLPAWWVVLRSMDGRELPVLTFLVVFVVSFILSRVLRGSNHLEGGGDQVSEQHGS